MKKWLKWTLIAVPVVVVAGVGIVILRLDSIVRATVESQAASQLRVPTTLGGASVSIFGGKVALSDLEIGSPPGFASTKLFSLGAIGVGVDYSQLRSDPIRVRSISIDKPKLVIEQKDGKINLKALLDQMPVTPTGTIGDKPAEPTDSKPLKLIIEKLSLTNASVTILPGIPGLPEHIDINVPSVELANIGTGDGNQNGVAIKEVVTSAMTGLALKASESDKIPPELRVILSGNLKQIVDEKLGAAKAQLQGAIDQIKADPASIKDAGKNLQEGLKGLIPGEGKDDKKKDAKKRDDKTSADKKKDDGKKSEKP